MKPEDVFGKDYDTFFELDPFNSNNLVEGFISRKSNEYYGALIITKVNNKKVTPQLIMSSPKMHYPFTSRQDGSRNYLFPSAKEIEVYEKLDGTNVVSYSYTDGKDTYYTYKTRLRPFLKSGRFGDFLSMWKEIATPYMPAIKRLMTEKQCNLAFEMFGSRNPHLLMYKVPLTFSLLFGVTNTGRILSPSKLQYTLGKGKMGMTDKMIGNLPAAPLLETIDKDYVWNYERLQKEFQDNLKIEDEGYYSGREGAVWYLHCIDDRCIQIKMKPEAIEAIHFSAGAKSGIGKNTVLATVYNSYENTDTPTVEFIKQLLIEEFKPEIVEANHYLIEKCVAFVAGEMNFRQDVLKEYKELGKSIILEKTEVMRALSLKFERNKMKKVYSIVKSFG